jgi:hypothetical protein
MDTVLNIKTIDYIVPFFSILSFLQALSVVKRIYCHNKKNYKQIHTVISSLIKNITESETETFVNKVITYSTSYPVDFFNEVVMFNRNLTDHLAQDNDNTLTLESPSRQCNNCYKGKMVTNWFRYKAPQFGKDGILYQREQVEKCRLNIKQCKYCEAYHYLSFSFDNKNKTKKFFVNAHEYQYFQYTTETIFERNLMTSLLADIVFKHCSFRAFSDTYNFMNTSLLPFRYLLNAKRLADAFFCFELCKFYSENMPYQLKSSFNFFITNVYFY